MVRTADLLGIPGGAADCADAAAYLPSLRRTVF